MKQLLLKAVQDAIGDAIQDDAVAIATKQVLHEHAIIVDGHRCETSERGAGRIVAEARGRGEDYLDFYMRQCPDETLTNDIIERMNERGYTVLEEA